MSLNSANQDFRVVADASDADTAIELFRKRNPDVTLLDVMMPGVSGTECLRRLIVEFSTARVLMLSSSDADEDIAQALDAGACGYVTKTALPADLIAAIHNVHSGNQSIRTELQRRLAERAATEKLSRREIEVLHLTVTYKGNPVEDAVVQFSSQGLRQVAYLSLFQSLGIGGHLP